MKKLFLFLVAMTLSAAAHAVKIESDGIRYSIGVGIEGPQYIAEVTGVTLTDAESIVIPTSVTYEDEVYKVTSIGAQAFGSCRNLTSVTLPRYASHISEFAFAGCLNLQEIIVTAGNAYLSSEDGVLFNRSKTTLLRCPQAKTECAIPSTVKTIATSAFESCTALTSIVIPAGVAEIGKYAFSGCSSLTEFIVEEENPVYSSQDGILFNSDKTMLILCPGAKTDCIIPPSVTRIGESAFSTCSSLTAVSIPSSVTVIDAYAFEGCVGLTSVILPNSVTFIDKGAFAACRNLTSITLPESLTRISESTFEFCESLTSITIPESITEIEERAFAYCASLTSATIPESVTAIGQSAFTCCTSLTSVSIPESVTEINVNLFTGCSALTSVTIPSAVTTIGYAAFRECSALTSVIIPANVNEIGSFAFTSCTNLSTIYNLNPTPQAIISTVFLDVPAEATLYVPAGSVTAYSEAEEWNYFTDIRAIGSFSISMNPQTHTLSVGETAEISATVEKTGDVVIASEEWSSSDESVATVENGVITAISAGETVISFSATDIFGTTQTGSCVVTVVAPTDGIDGVFSDKDAADVYTLHGVLLLREATAAEVNALPAGIYILRQGAAAKKIAVK